jgi:hypothetical protein
MVVAHQSLDHRQVDPGLGQRRAERVPQRVWVSGAHAAAFAVIPEDRAQPGRRQRLSAMRAFRHDEQGGAIGFGRSASR